MDTNLIAATPEFSEDITGQHPGIAAGHIYVQVVQSLQVVERVIESNLITIGIVGIRYLVGHLYLIDKQIKLLGGILYDTAHICRKLQGIPVADVTREVELDGDDIVRTDTLLQKIIPVESAQQIGFSTAPDTGNDLDSSVVHFCNQLI